MNQFFKKTLSILGTIYIASMYLNFFALLCISSMFELQYGFKPYTSTKNSC